jgi:ADP-heptose:LPS heptosyltransferase
MENKYDVFWVIGDGIGNIIEALYSIEYCLRLNLKIGVTIKNTNESFSNYLKECYPSIIIDDTNNIQTNTLIHSWLIKEKFEIQYQNFFLVSPSEQSSLYQSESELYLNIVKSLYPNGEVKEFLEHLKKERPSNLIDVKEKVVLYPGCFNHSPSKRWPHYEKLAQLLGLENVVFVGSQSDLDFESSFIYKKIVSKLFSQKFLNYQSFWRIAHKLFLTLPFSHLSDKTINGPNALFNKLNWPELVYVLNNCKSFVGNDGGLSHLAAACNARGIVFFGPTCPNKNSHLNKKIESKFLSYECQPCFYNKKNIPMAFGFINCPYGVKCMNNILPEEIFTQIN